MEYRVIIIDDDVQDSILIKNEIEHIYMDGVAFYVQCVTDKQFMNELFEVENPVFFDLYVIDIDMPYLNGVCISNEIRKVKPNAKIYLSSNHDDLILQFGIDGFIRKANLKHDVPMMLYRFLQSMKATRKYVYAYNGEVQSIDYQDVMYIEVCDNDASIITRKNKTGFRERKTLKQFEKIFQQPDFIRISKRYIVNLYNVDMLSNGTFKMKNGVSLKIPKNNLEKIRRAYITYCLRR